MNKQLLISTLEHHGVECADNGHFVNVKEKWTLNGVPGFDWGPFYFDHWTMRDLLRDLGY